MARLFCILPTIVRPIIFGVYFVDDNLFFVCIPELFTKQDCQNFKVLSEIASSGSVRLPTAQIWLPATSGFPIAKIAVQNEETCECEGHAVHKFSQRRLTTD